VYGLRLEGPRGEGAARQAGEARERFVTDQLKYILVKVSAKRYVVCRLEGSYATCKSKPFDAYAVITCPLSYGDARVALNDILEYGEGAVPRASRRLVEGSTRKPRKEVKPKRPTAAKAEEPPVRPRPVVRNVVAAEWD
jgi:hypothetical protein